MARITAIHLDDDENPATVSLVLTVQEALAIARTFGQMFGSDPATTDVYEALTMGFFNRYWDDGVYGATRDHPAPLEIEQRWTRKEATA